MHNDACEETSDESYVIAVVPNRDIDILFVIDNSGSMAEEQVALAASFAELVAVLERPELGFNYRIGVTTTDNGNPWCGLTTPEAGALQLSSCRSRPEDFVTEGSVIDGVGALDATQEACNAVCPAQWAEIETLPTTIEEEEEPRPRRWLERSSEGTNLPEGLSMAQALQCIGPQGISGCSFESPLESMWKTIGRSRTDGDPSYGFIRDHASLVVVFVTDEADCSTATAWNSIFLPDGDRRFWSDPDAPIPTSAVCWNAGVACDGASPNECHAVDLDVGGNAVPASEADDLAVLFPLSRYVDLLQTLEDNKQTIFPEQRVIVKIIGGVSSDGSVTYDASPQDPEFQLDFGIGPGCESESGRAVPPVRLRALAEAFALDDESSSFSICEPEYSSALEPIAQALAVQSPPLCMPACVADARPSTPDVVDPTCRLRQGPPNGQSTFEETDIPRCEADAGLPTGYDVCYVPLVGDERSAWCMDEGSNLEFQLVRREGVYVPPGAVVWASCTLSQCAALDCPELM